LQCLWKHRSATLSPRRGTLGLIALPQTWLFQFLFSLLAPLVDVALVWRLALSSYDLLQHPDQFDSDTLLKVLCYYLAFLLIDCTSAAIALAMERKEKWSLLPWLVLQRFGYRQLMYYVVVKAMLAAVLGPLVGWGKLERQATVTDPV
jgi:peptidoglycan-N-acetylglucosamine deacetylase